MRDWNFYLKAIFCGLLYRWFLLHKKSSLYDDLYFMRQRIFQLPLLSLDIPETFLESVDEIWEFFSRGK